MRYWHPGVPQWIPALLAVVALYTINSMAVKSYGELEFWLALVKVGTECWTRYPLHCFARILPRRAAGPQSTRPLG